MAKPVDNLWYLKRIHLFRSLDANALDRLNQLAVHQRLQRGQIIFGPDDPGDAIHLLKEGRVKLSRFDARGREIILAILEDGEFFGEEALVAGERCNGYAEALEPGMVYRVSTGDFERLMAEHPDVAVAVARQMSQRLLGAHSRIESLAFQDVSARLAGALVQLGERHGVAMEDGRTRVDLRVTHQELANLIASTRETTTSLLNRFKREGWIDSQDRWLVINRPEALREEAGLE